MAKVKVMFELDPEDWHGCPAETLWAELADRSDGGRFRLLNSPFYARGINHQDVVEATFVEGSHLVFLFKRVAERGGHSTYMILAKKDEPRLDHYWRLLENVGCAYEGASVDLSVGERRLLSVDVPPSTDLDEVRELLERGHHDQVWIFQEGYKHGAGST
jgi:hypothetical protein